MKNRWWNDLSHELQDAADRHDSKRFYNNLKGVWTTLRGPSAFKGRHHLTNQSSQLPSALGRYFNSVLSQSQFNVSVLDEVPQTPVEDRFTSLLGRKFSEQSCSYLTDPTSWQQNFRSLQLWRPVAWFHWSVAWSDYSRSWQKPTGDSPARVQGCIHRPPL